MISNGVDEVWAEGLPMPNNRPYSGRLYDKFPDIYSNTFSDTFFNTFSNTFPD